jgi:hypothetical protein
LCKASFSDSVNASLSLIASDFVVLVLSEAVLVLSEAVLVLSEAVLVLDGCLNSGDSDRCSSRIAYPIGKTVSVTVASLDSSPAKSRIL